jgi:hypothetical protein
MPSSPNKLTWVIALILGIIGIVAHFVSIPVLTDYNYWLLLAGFIVFAVGTTFKGI